jgi:hypothetical protein
MLDFLKKWLAPRPIKEATGDIHVPRISPLIVDVSREFINPRDLKKKKQAEDFQRIKIENQALRDELCKLEMILKEFELIKDGVKEENSSLLMQLLFLQDEIGDLIIENSTLADGMAGLNKKLNDLTKLSEDRLTEVGVTRAEKMKAFEDLASLKSHQTDLTQKYESSLKENSLLLRQLHQIQEDLESLDAEYKQSAKLVLELNARWSRIEAKTPTLVDYERVIIENVDTISNSTSVTFKLDNCFYADKLFDVIRFQVVLIEGRVAILLIQEDSPDKNFLLIPELAQKSQDEYSKYVSMSYKQWLHLKVAASVLLDLIRNKWVDVSSVSFDPSFWSSMVLSLVKAVEQLPPVLRYSNVTLKRELVHVDYEHLWLEVHNIEFGTYKKKKLEVRLGAALISGVGAFSQFPKIEFPLINGNIKPFESWYPESNDDFGPKFELRFSLDRGLVDFAALSKLNNADRALVCAICFGMPAILDQLSSNQLALSRPIKDWRNFSNTASELLIKKIQESRTAEKIQNAPNPNQGNESLSLTPKLIKKVETSSKKIRVEKMSKRVSK